MAAVIRKLASPASPVAQLKSTSRLSRSFPNVQPSRGKVCSSSGAVCPEPETNGLGVLKAILAVLPGLYVGASISKQGAAFLEENDIFVPDEDDDDG